MGSLKSYIVIAFVFLTVNLQAQSDSVSKDPDLSKKTYVFYLHGGVVQEYGANAISKYFGKYEYHAILDTLDNYGFTVISEVRAKGTEEKEYAKKIKSQIDTLLASGIPPKNIIIIGASQGAYIALETALLLQNPEIGFILLGLCSDYAMEYFNDHKDKFYGRFLSIYESSDSKGPCVDLFKDQKNLTFTELQLNMGIDHAFLFKPYKEWVEPAVAWINQK